MYLVHILNELAGNSFMIFCGTCNNTVRTALLLRHLGFMAVPLHGQMSQNKRLAALTKFKAKNRSILISTDVASRFASDTNISLNFPFINFYRIQQAVDYILFVSPCLFNIFIYFFILPDFVSYIQGCKNVNVKIMH